MPLSDIFLDPNNPRISPEPAPGYADFDLLLNPDNHEALRKQVYEVYNAGPLETSIIEQGWTPVDPIIVWCPPGRDQAVVVEGNTRVSVLGSVRTRLPREVARLERMKKAGAQALEIGQQQELIDAIQALIDQTEQIRVYPVKADSIEELQRKLPRLLGVRHISPAKSWGPYATNLYVRGLYQAEFEALHGKDAKFALDDNVLDVVSRQVPSKPEEIRRAIQAVSAFGHFKRLYGDKVEDAGNVFRDGDQYYFDLILINPHARDEFQFGKSDLNLSEEAEEALFQWAFAKPRPQNPDDNENVFKKAEDIRAWQKIARYDNKTGVTSFAKRLDISSPTDAVPISRLTLLQGAHKEQASPIETLSSLLKALKELKADTLQAQAGVLLPLLNEIGNRVDGFKEMAHAANHQPEDH